MKSKLNVLLAFSLLLTLTPALLAADAPKYQVTGQFAVTGEGGWDYLSLDADGARLFISRGTHVQVVDTATGKLLGDIPDTLGVHGIAVASDLGVGVTSNGKAGQPYGVRPRQPEEDRRSEGRHQARRHHLRSLHPPCLRL